MKWRVEENKQLLDVMYIKPLTLGQRIACFVEPLRDLIFDYRGTIEVHEGEYWCRRPQGFLDRVRSFWVSSVYTAICGFRLEFRSDIE